MVTTSQTGLKVADEVWIATALLHREHPEQSDFSTTEIEVRARTEASPRALRPGVRVHIIQHCVANRPPNPGRYRMLVETNPHRRRLFRPGDAYDAGREGAKQVPSRTDIPSRYHQLLDWYATKYAPRRSASLENDPILALRGLGKHIWADEDADAYVARLREGWA
jgi:hypothetical protein